MHWLIWVIINSIAMKNILPASPLTGTLASYQLKLYDTVVSGMFRVPSEACEGRGVWV